MFLQASPIGGFINSLHQDSLIGGIITGTLRTLNSTPQGIQVSQRGQQQARAEAGRTTNRRRAQRNGTTEIVNEQKAKAVIGRVAMEDQGEGEVKGIMEVAQGAANPLAVGLRVIGVRQVGTHLANPQDDQEGAHPPHHHPPREVAEGYRGIHVAARIWVLMRMPY